MRTFLPVVRPIAARGQTIVKATKLAAEAK